MVTQTPVAQASYQGGELLPAVGTDTYKQAQALANTSTAPKADNTKPIDAGIVGNASNTPSLAKVDTTNADNALSLSVSSVANQAAQNLAQNTAQTPPTESQKTKQTLTDKLLGLINLQGKRGEKQQEYSTAENVQGLKTQATDLENKIIAGQKAYNDQVAKIQQNATGKSTEAINAEIANLTRDFNSQQANLAISYKVAAGAYNDAAQLVQDKLNAEFSGIDQQIQGLSTLYNFYQNDMTESEKLQANAKIQEQKDARDQLYNAKAEAHKIALDGGAPASVLASIDAAQTPDAAYSAVGKYGISARDRASIASSNASVASLSQPVAVDQTGSPTQSILAQTGLSLIAFNYLTQGTAALSRMGAAQRKQVQDEAQGFLNKNGLDVSTFQSRYRAYNDVLQKNIARANQTSIFSGEIQGTVDQFIADTKDDFGNLAPATVAKLYAGKQVNNPTVQKYTFDLQTLRNDLAGYLAASRGANLPEKTDLEDAAKVIVSGLSSRSADAFKQSIITNEEKVTNVVNNAVDSANKKVWELFGVGDKYAVQAKSKNISAPTNNDPLGLGI